MPLLPRDVLTDLGCRHCGQTSPVLGKCAGDALIQDVASRGLAEQRRVEDTITHLVTAQTLLYENLTASA